MLGTPLNQYAKNILTEVISVGRAGSLVDWESDSENRVYVSTYAAESILNWRVELINGRNIPTLVVLHEATSVAATGFDAEDLFERKASEQIRVLRLVPESQGTLKCVVEIWKPEVLADGHRSTSRRQAGFRNFSCTLAHSGASRRTQAQKQSNLRLSLPPVAQNPVLNEDHAKSASHLWHSNSNSSRRTKFRRNISHFTPSARARGCWMGMVRSKRRSSMSFGATIWRCPRSVMN